MRQCSSSVLHAAWSRTAAQQVRVRYFLNAPGYLLEEGWLLRLPVLIGLYWLIGFYWLIDDIFWPDCWATDIYLWYISVCIENNDISHELNESKPKRPKLQQPSVMKYDMSTDSKMKDQLDEQIARAFNACNIPFNIFKEIIFSM